MRQMTGKHGWDLSVQVVVRRSRGSFSKHKLTQIRNCGSSTFHKWFSWTSFRWINKYSICFNWWNIPKWVRGHNLVLQIAACMLLIWWNRYLGSESLPHGNLSEIYEDMKRCSESCFVRSTRSGPNSEKLLTTKLILPAWQRSSWPPDAFGKGSIVQYVWVKSLNVNEDYLIIG